MLSDFCLRQTFGRVFCTRFPSGLVVPWKPLSMGDYIQHAQDTRVSRYLPAEIEDQLFDSCVTDQTLVARRALLPAGVVSVVASNIWQFSGPTGIEAFNKDLDQARQEIVASEEAVIHDLVQIITLAFPYRPEEVYAMSYDTLLLRTAQAEKKLLQTGLLEEPVRLFDGNEDPKAKKKRPKVDLKALYEQQHRIEQSGEDFSSVKRDKWWKISPVLEAQNAELIDFNHEKRMIEQGPAMQFRNKAGTLVTEKQPRLSSMATADRDLATHAMVERAKKIYAPLIAELNKRRELAKKQ